MQTFPSRNQFTNNSASAALLTALETGMRGLHLGDALLYRSFPLYKDDEGNVIVGDCVLVAPRYGVVTIALSESTPFLSHEESQRCLDVTEQVPPYIQSRLIKNRTLRKGPTQLSFEITPVVFAPSLKNVDGSGYDFPLIVSTAELADFFRILAEKTEPIEPKIFDELVATIEGAKGLVRPKKRQPNLKAGSKGQLAALVEAAITLFDQQQKHGMMGRVTGPQRVRGLAGSGKTIVLAMKAAQIHLQDPEARIAYTFNTKSLYQHVKRLITRFYRQFDDSDPDWDKHLHVLHAWGGQNAPGIYSVACDQNGVTPIRFQDAAAVTFGDRFDFVCQALMNHKAIEPVYDYIFIDEGQDFPLSFIRLCHRLAKNGRFVLAYDDLQTIFQAATPSTIEIFGADSHGKPIVEFEEDVILHKCYRNPREILVTAHALGFGLYGPSVVQMLESKDHWEDIGYKVIEGDFMAGSMIKIERPKENSLEIVSARNSFEEIVHCNVVSDVASEIALVADSIMKDLSEGLQPDDILVVSVDDRNAKRYLGGIELALHHLGVKANNLHNDDFGIRDFIVSERVTLATVHKAKGNEAFMVYVVGVDAVMHTPNVRNRNMLFTAMTRAKGWVRVSGIGESAERCKKEIEHAQKHFPCLVFSYPKPEDAKRMKRDLAEAADKRMRARRMVERLKEEYSDAEIADMLSESGHPEKPMVRSNSMKRVKK